MSQKERFFKKKVIKRIVGCDPITKFFETFLIQRRIQRDISINAYMSSYKTTVIIVKF